MDLVLQKDAWKMEGSKNTFQSEETKINNNGCPEYVRPDNGHTIKKKKPISMWCLTIESCWLYFNVI